MYIYLCLIWKCLLGCCVRIKHNILLKPTGHVMHQQFNNQQLYLLPTLYLFCIYLRTNSDSCHLQHELIGFYNRDEKCLLRGTNWVFIKVSQALSVLSALGT